MPVPRVIVCVECGGRAHLLRDADPDDLDPYAAGDALAYRCEDCLERFDVVMTEDDVNDESGAN